MMIKTKRLNNIDSTFETQNKFAEKLFQNPEFKGKLTVVTKATRSGCTYSLCKQAVLEKQKTVIIEPYTKIFGTVKEAAEKENGTVAELESNWNMCLKLQEKYPKDIFGNIPYFFLENCEKCNKVTKCPMQQVLTGDWNVLVLTTLRFKVLNLS